MQVNWIKYLKYIDHCNIAGKSEFDIYEYY